MNLPRPTRFPLALCPVLLALTACRDPQPAAYRTPKEQDPVPHAAPVASAESPRAPSGVPAPTDASSAMAATPVATATGASLTWSAPARRHAKPASSMRRDSYTITGEGSATAELALTPLADAEAAAALTRYTVGDLKLAVVDLTGTANGGPARLLGAMVPFGGATWFFKLIEPDALVAQEKTAFLAFLQTV